MYSGLFFFVCTNGQSQTFNGAGGAVPGSSTTPTCFNINVTGVGIINSTTNGLASVCLNITHGDVGDLEITLTAPDGTMVPLSVQNGDAGNNYTNTCFTATAASSIKFANPPFSGNFLPEGWLGAVNNGQNANGNWSLCVRDRRNPGSSGSLVNWSLTFNATPAPMPPSLPACANTLPSTSSCSTATLVCDFNGQCGSTTGSSVQTWPGSGLDDCFGLQNNSFIRFVASATTATFSVWVPTTAQTNQQGGIQMMFFSGTCNSGAVTSHGCYPRILPYPGNGQPLVTVVTANNLTPGNTYYLMIDGANNDNCTFTIAANTGVNVLNINPAAPDICAGQSVNLTASGGNGTYSWSPSTNLSATTGTTVTANPTSTTTYTVTSTTTTGCPLTKDVTVTVNPVPTTPTATISQPSCSVQTGSIAITAPVGTGLLYNINGGTYQSSNVFSGLAANASYTVTVQNASGCISTPATFSINAVPPIPSPLTYTITQPTCAEPTGTITVTSPLGSQYGYRLSTDPPGYQTSPVFSNLAPGNYILIVGDINNVGCNNFSSNIIINAAPTAPVTPTATLIQPTCSNPIGVITVTAPTGAGLQYSINGGPYQSSTIFSGLTPDDYTITVQNAAGCTSPASPTYTIVSAINTQPGPLNITTVHPNCGESTGSIILTSPAGTNLEFSINGTNYQTSTTFNNVAPGNYSITVRNTVTGCISTATPVTVNAAPTLPSAPTGSVTIQPDCSNPAGQINISAPVGANYEYAINNGPYQSSPVFNNLTAGTYLVVVRNTISGCISPALSLTVNNGPARPDAPALNLSLPTCTRFDAIISVTSPLGNQYQYSLNGGTFMNSPNFSVLVEGDYEVRVRDINTGCISLGTTIKVIVGPTTPQKPVITPVQPSCPLLTGTITVDSPTGANIEYSINGTSFQSSNIFSNVAGGTYNVTARFVGTTCISSPTSVTIFGLTPEQCLQPTDGDIYFPTAFTPNSDGLNDGFGPGPKSSLGAVTQYRLQIYNRYGELVFSSTNPLLQWDGRYKGKILGNNSYTWVAQFRLNGLAPETRKGTVTLIR